jgi:hypothetical protein
MKWIRAVDQDEQIRFIQDRIRSGFSGRILDPDPVRSAALDTAQVTVILILNFLNPCCCRQLSEDIPLGRRFENRSPDLSFG